MDFLITVSGLETKSRKKDLRFISWPNKSRGAKAIKDSRDVTKHFAETFWTAGRKFQLQKLTVLILEFQ